MSCIFCRIAEGQIPAERLLETAEVVVFRDLAPQAPFHALVIPRMHIKNVGEADKSHQVILGAMLLACRQVVEDAGLVESGFRIVLNNNGDAGQTVDHLHAHVLAGRKLDWPPG